MKCFISKNYRHVEGAGDKAKTDIEQIMLGLGYKNIGLAQARSKGTVAAYFITLASVLKGLSRLRRGDILVVQYPLKKYYDMVVRTAVRRGVKVVTLIHDLGSFRRKKLTVSEEVTRLNRSAAIIVHTESMKRWLLEHGVRSQMVVLGLFDYLSDSEHAEKPQTADARRSVMFAGNNSPEANGWIYKLAADSPGLAVILYGGGVDGDRRSANMVEKGFVDSDTLIREAEGDFGIVWYGDSLDEGTGNLGEYLQYNAPHKTSLYLRAGIPVIIWDKAGLADTVRRYGVGLCVPSLRDLERTLAEVSPEQYVRMKDNARMLARRLAKGTFAADALAEAMKMVE